MLMRHAIAGNNQQDKLYVDDVFSTYTYTGNGSTQTINNGIDLAGEGGMVWLKFRSGSNVSGHWLYDSVRGATKHIRTNADNPESTDTTSLTSFNANGFSFGNYGEINYNTDSYASWTFRKAPKFFSLSTVTKSSGSDATVSFTDLETLGMVIVKRTDSTGSWYVWHRSLTAGKLLYLEQTAAEATLGHITVSGTTVTLENGVIADGTYIVYAYAHDTSEDGLIQCGSYVGNGSTQEINIGIEPQFVMIKGASILNTSWLMLDNMRGFPVSGNTERLDANSSGAGFSTTDIAIRNNGFWVNNDTNTNSNGQTYIYLAIRRSNKPPTSGTQVYNAIARTGTWAAATITGVGFSPDLTMIGVRTGLNIYNNWFDRLRGAKQRLFTQLSLSEATEATSLTGFDIMDGIILGTDLGYGAVNTNPYTYINHFFKRATGFFDIVCYTGTGVARTVNHNLGVIPELIIAKGRSVAESWYVYSSYLTSANYTFLINNTAGEFTSPATWNSSEPTSSIFNLGYDSGINGSSSTYVAYLFASLAGISKIGNYTGNGSTQNIDCGFSAGARFVLIKASSTTGDWYIWDTVRGIVAASDPHLSLNTTAAEVTTDDSIDPLAAGFTVNQVAATNINVTSATYIYLAIA